MHYYFPSIAVNSRGDAVLGFSGSSANQFVSAYFTSRRATDQAGTMRSPIRVIKDGENILNDPNLGGNGVGDYSATTLDPNDGLTIWTVQEYAAGSGCTTNCAIWGTWIKAINPY